MRHQIIRFNEINGSGFSITPTTIINFDLIKTNPIVTFNFEINKPIGRCKNIRRNKHGYSADIDLIENSFSKALIDCDVFAVGGILNPKEYNDVPMFRICNVSIVPNINPDGLPNQKKG